MPTDRPDKTERILLIRPSALGDVCRSVPVAVSLKRAFPGARLDWLVQDSFADAVRHHPAVDRVIEFPRARFAAWWRPGRALELLGWLNRLRRERYDLVVDAQGLARSGGLAWVTRARRRIGFADARELGWLGVNERHRVPSDLHTVDRMLELLRLAGIEPVRDLRLYPPAEAWAWLASQHRLAGTRYAVLAPTSRWPAKQWPADRFAEVGRRLLERGFEAVAVVGAAGERGQVAPVLELAAREPRVVDLIGGTGVGPLMAVIERAALVVANDSAALHMAVGLDRPAIGLYGPTRVDRVGPYAGHRPARPVVVLQHVTAADRLDHKDPRRASLMARIGVEEVLASVERASSPLL